MERKCFWETEFNHLMYFKSLSLSSHFPTANINFFHTADFLIFLMLWK